MANGNSNSLPLYEKVAVKNTVYRALDIIILFLLLSLLGYRLHFLYCHGFSWLLAIALLSELWFTVNRILLINVKWNPVDPKMYPVRLLQRVRELPRVDMFVTTADPELEPPIMTINTVLSLLAVDYPSNKLACYVSDDGCSSLTYYSLTEAVKFAELWVPFCKKYNVQVRAPFRYFSKDYNSIYHHSSMEFQHDWKTTKDEYEKLSRKVEYAVQNGVPLTEEFSAFSNTEPRNHPSIIKIIWENREGRSDGLPHLVYISREKQPKHHHRYKAGAMNVLTRVSGLMTNAPYMMNVDCDMFVNNPKIVLYAMCVLLDPKSDQEIAFVQSPQCFYDGLKDDPYGNQYIILFQFMGRGIAGLQGPLYGGTGCFHRRKVIYGLSPADADNVNGEISEKELIKYSFGSSKEFVNSAAHALKAKTDYPNKPSDFLEAANQVAGCRYEYGTSWGTKVGWMYGSATEDVLTGLTIHKRGWKSVACSPDPPAFLGCAPSGGPASLTQQKRWATGLLEIFFSKNCPIFASLAERLQFRQCLSYIWLSMWAFRSLPELCYTALPAYCIITNSHFLPKVKESAVWIPMTLFVIYNIESIAQHFGTGQSIRAWWNNHRMARINTTCAWFFGLLSVILKLLGLSETVFEVTKKDQSSSSQDNDADAGKFTFDESPLFIPGTTILLLQLAALLIGLLGLQPQGHDREGAGLGEVFCSVWMVLCFSPFLRGMFGKGRYGIPLSTKCKSLALALLFVHLSRRSR